MRNNIFFRLFHKELVSLFFAALSFSEQALAQDKDKLTIEKSIQDSFIKTLPEAVADSTLSDSTAFALNMIFTGVGSPLTLANYYICNLVNYFVRKTGKDYLHESSSSLQNCLLGVLGGGVEGTLQLFVLRDRHLVRRIQLSRLLRSALNAGLYELSEAYLDITHENKDYAIFYGITVGIESFDRFLEFCFEESRNLNNFWMAIREGIAYGLGVGATTDTSHAYYSQKLEQWVRSWLENSESEKNFEKEEI